ncbi:MAG: LapA family protein [Burkholderiaceae bacterium]|nr:LapA family protein [Burkholderiaceae bacterium]
MRILAWLFNILLFIVVLAFALSNTATSELHFFLIGDQAVWRAPLVIFLLIFFVGGVVVGMLFTMPSYFRQRREIARLRKAQKLHSEDGGQARPTEAVVVPAGDSPGLVAPSASTAAPARLGG